MAEIIKSDGMANPDSITLDKLWKTEKAYFFIQDDHITVVVNMGSKHGGDNPAALVFRYNKEGDSYGAQVMHPDHFAKLLQKLNN